MKNKWLKQKKVKLHKDLHAEVMAAMSDEMTLGELIDYLPKNLKDYFLGMRIYGLESCEDEHTLDFYCEHYDGPKPFPKVTPP